MSESIASVLVWFRNDLRVEDHQGLQQALDSQKRVIAYYSFSPKLFQPTAWGFKKTEKYRAQFLIESVAALKAALEKLNISLIIDLDAAEDSLADYLQQYDIQTVYLQEEWTDEEKKEEVAVATKASSSIQWIRHYEQFLFHPDELTFLIKQTPEVFGNFRRKCEKEVTVRPLISSNLPLAKTNRIELDHPLPHLSDLGLEGFETDARSAFPFRGGTQNATQRLQHYFWNSKKLSYYKNTRNGLLGTDYSSKFSAWLANGSLSPKMIYFEIKRYESEIQKNQSTYWLIFELIWRDYFKYISLKHGNKIFQLGGILERNYRWETDKKKFEQWAKGQTPEPFVNANMVEMKKTGWMSNRGRQNVASYFSKDMKMDWRIGAAYFESLLLDYDVHSNYGNWMYVSGVGNGPRDRKFDVRWQAERYDAKGKFQNLWLQKTLF
jgi:deoxyribodipyrimidine photo-lyase